MEIIVTNPLVSVSLVFALWQFFNYIFKKFPKLTPSEIEWKRLEFVWIFAGLFGLSTLVMKNRNEFINNEIKYLKFDLDIDYDNLKMSLGNLENCFQFTQHDKSPTDIDLIQKDQNLICNWSQDISKLLDSIKKEDYTKKLIIDSINSLDLKTQYKKDNFNKKVNKLSDFNYKIEQVANKQNSIMFTNKFSKIINVIGAWTLIVAFAIRLCIASHNLKKEKKHN